MTQVVQADQNNRYRELMDNICGRRLWSFDASTMYMDIIFPQCLLVVLILQNLSAIFSKWTNQSLRECWTFKIFWITGGEFTKCKFWGEICNKNVIDWKWWNMPALGLWAEANLASSVRCTTQRPRAGIFRHIQSITYNIYNGIIFPSLNHVKIFDSITDEHSRKVVCQLVKSHAQWFTSNMVKRVCK